MNEQDQVYRIRLLMHYQEGNMTKYDNSDLPMIPGVPHTVKVASVSITPSKTNSEVSQHVEPLTFTFEYDTDLDTPVMVGALDTHKNSSTTDISKTQTKHKNNYSWKFSHSQS